MPAAHRPAPVPEFNISPDVPRVDEDVAAARDVRNREDTTEAGGAVGMDLVEAGADRESVPAVPSVRGLHDVEGESARRQHPAGAVVGRLVADEVGAALHVRVLPKSV